MKKILLVVVLLFTLSAAQSKIIVRQFDPSAGTLWIQNIAGFAYDYSNFMLSINLQNFVLSNLTIESGNLNAADGEIIKFKGLSFPRAAGASVAIWYPGSLPGTPTPSNIIDFVQYGAGGHDFESVAVSAGIWTAGDYISGVPPYIRTTNNHGLGEWQTASGISNINMDDQIEIFPNPFGDLLKISVSTFFTKGNSYELEIYGIDGKVVRRYEELSEKDFIIGEEDLKAGIYFVQLTNEAGDSVVKKLIKGY